MEALLKGAVDTFTAPFRAVDDLVGKLFRNSISTDMKVDFDEASKHAKVFGKDVASSMNVAVAPLSSAGVATQPGGIKPKALPPSIRKPMVSSSDTQASLVNAVNMPAWYARYEALFNARMTALEAAMGAGSPKGGRTSRGGFSKSGPQDVGGEDGMGMATGISNRGFPSRGGK
jgi:hypothetical protein